MLQLVWLLFAYIGVALFFALDMVHVADLTLDLTPPLDLPELSS